MFIFPADDARRLALQIGNREDLFGLRAAHRAAEWGSVLGIIKAESLCLRMKLRRLAILFIISDFILIGL